MQVGFVVDAVGGAFVEFYVQVVQALSLSNEGFVVADVGEHDRDGGSDWRGVGDESFGVQRDDATGVVRAKDSVAHHNSGRGAEDLLTCV